MNAPINPSRIRKALEALEEARSELNEALADAERPNPEIPSRPIKVY
jgi:hypothetical protein